MTRKLVAYLAHPVGAPDRAGIDATLANARAWLRFLVDTTDLAVSAPWMPYVEALSEDKYRDRGLEDDLAMLERHDAIVLVGGRVSRGMEMERTHAMDLGLPVVDLSAWRSPPVTAIDDCREALTAIARCRQQLAARADRTRRG